MVKVHFLLNERVSFLNVEDVQSGKFLKSIPPDIIIEPRCSNIVRDVFRWCILTGMKNLPLETEEIYPYGWYKKQFHWKDGRKKIPEDNHYQIMTDAAILMRTGSDAIIAICLAGIHGPLEGFLHDVGIDHNFVTALEGGSGVGKTSILKLCKNGVTGKAASLASERKDLLKMVAEETDITLLLDDYNKAESGRTSERIKQTVSEIIQSQSDSERLVMEGSDGVAKFVHVVISSEPSFKNLSTINRTYRVEMAQPLPLGVFEKMKAFGSENMLLFIQMIINYVELNYEEIAAQCKASYQLFLDECRKKYEYSRIADTIAVQKTLKTIIILYYKSMRIDERYVQQVDMTIEESIGRIGREMCGLMKSMNKETKEMIALPKLADSIEKCDTAYNLSGSEKKYMKEKRNLSETKTIGFCAVEGYLSFDMESILELINSGECAGGGISKQLLSKELNDQNLAHKDSEKKLNSRWHTKHRMYHVQVRPLVEMFHPNIGDEDIQSGLDMVMERVLSYFKPNI